MSTTPNYFGSGFYLNCFCYLVFPNKVLSICYLLSYEVCCNYISQVVFFNVIVRLTVRLLIAAEAMNEWSYCTSPVFLQSKGIGLYR